MRPLCLSAWLLVAATPGVARAGAWANDSGVLDIKVSASHWRAGDKFASTLDQQLTLASHVPPGVGDRVPFDPSTGGVFMASALTLEGTLGLPRRVEVGVQAPLVWMDFDTEPIDTVASSVGLGDLRVLGKWQGLQWERLAAAVLLRAKVPVGRFEPSVDSAALSEGQFDVAAGGSVGASLYPYGYANVEALWRWRLENPTSQRRPGNELELTAEVGVDVTRWLLVKGTWDLLLGQDGVQRAFGLQTPTPRRRMSSVWLGALLAVSDQWRFEAHGRAFVWGENMPAGWQVFVGASWRTALLD